MLDDPGKHRRRSIRLKGYDYAQPGAYFVTLCTQYQEPFFGRIGGERTVLNPAGEMVWRWWYELNNKYPTVRTDAAVVMPNHFHGVIVIAGQPAIGQPHTGQSHRAAHTDDDTLVGATLRGRPGTDADVTFPVTQPETGQPRRAAPTGDDDADVGATLCGRPALGEIVGWFKTMTTNEYIHGVNKRVGRHSRAVSGSVITTSISFETGSP